MSHKSSQMCWLHSKCHVLLPKPNISSDTPWIPRLPLCIGLSVAHLSRPLDLRDWFWHLLVERLRQHERKESGGHGENAKDDHWDGRVDVALVKFKFMLQHLYSKTHLFDVNALAHYLIECTIVPSPKDQRCRVLTSSRSWQTWKRLRPPRSSHSLERVRQCRGMRWRTSLR